MYPGRTTDSAVGFIIEVDPTITAGELPGTAPFIEVANYLVTNICTSPDYDEGALELIERWLAAHFYSVRDPRPVSERAGSVGQSFQSVVKIGFDSSHYGQMAMRLDYAGGLARLNERIKQGLLTPIQIWSMEKGPRGANKPVGPWGPFGWFWEGDV